jgi:hypothetical protein
MIQIQSCGDDTTEIDVRPDGSWRVKGGPELKELAKWHLPVGTLCMATDLGATPNVGVVKHEAKEEPLSEEPGCRLKLEIRKNSNGQWQIRKKKPWCHLLMVMVQDTLKVIKAAPLSQALLTTKVIKREVVLQNQEEMIVL